MRTERQGGRIRVVLSKRNLLVLLTKLDWDESARTIINGDVAVSAEPDEEHYKDHEPGEMHPLTEAAILRH